MVELARQRLALQPRVLPMGVIAIGDGQVCEGRFRTKRFCPVKSCDIAHEDVDGPTVADDVVDVEEQPMSLVVETQQMQAEERAFRQIEGLGAMTAGQAPGLCFALAGGERRQVRDA